MSANVDRVEAETADWPENERADLAYRLLRSLAPSDDATDEQWQETIDRRIAEIHSGNVVGRTWEEIMTELQERIS